MGEWLSQRSVGEVACLLLVAGFVVAGIIHAIRGKDF